MQMVSPVWWSSDVLLFREMVSPVVVKPSDVLLCVEMVSPVVVKPSDVLLCVEMVSSIHSRAWLRCCI